MKLPKIDIKIKNTNIISIKSIYLAILVLVAISTIIIIFYIFRILFTTLNSSNKIIILRSEIAPETFSINDFEDALDKLNKKIDQTENINWPTIKNIFAENETAKPLPEPKKIEEEIEAEIINLEGIRPL